MSPAGERRGRGRAALVAGLTVVLCGTGYTGVALAFSVTVAFGGTAAWGLRTGHLPRTFAEYLDVLAVAWVVAFGLSVQLLLRLPDGRLPSPRWRWVAQVSAALLLPTVVGFATTPGAVEQVPGTENPLGMDWASALTGAVTGEFAGLLAGIAALVLRYRRGSRAERAQLQWVAVGGVVMVLLVAVGLGGSEFVPDDARAQYFLHFVEIAGLSALPVAIGVAVLRRGLYDLGTVVRRTLVYAVLTVLLAAVYVGLVLLAQLLLDPVTEGSGVAVAISTLAVAALFHPARGRIQTAVDQRFFRGRYDASATVDAFAGRLRDELDLIAVRDDLTTTVAGTLQPMATSLWVARR